ncbi:MAG: alkaline phosphatase family protein [Candidatus Dormibacteria bacterium]
MRRGSAIAAAGLAAAGILAASPVNAGTSLEGVPAHRHVGVLVLENESESATFGSGSPATYLNSLLTQGAFAGNYYADGHVSLDNYVTMTSGQPGNLASYSDCMTQNLYQCQLTVNTPVYGSGINIADQVENTTSPLSNVKETWKEYADSMPSPCFHGDLSPTAAPPDPYQGDGSGDSTYTGDYADRHNPFVYYSDITGTASSPNPRCAAHVVPFTTLAADLSSNSLPDYFFITPDTCHDGHDGPTCANGQSGGLVAADTWLENNLPSLLAYLNANDGVLFITFDEGNPTGDETGCCTGGQGGTQGFGGKVGLLALGAGVKTGSSVSQPATANAYDHASLLRTTEDALGISTYLNNASTATPMSDLFAQPSTDTPEAPLVLLLPVAAGATVAATALWRRRRYRR